MFALTRKTDYAIIALSHMARNPGCVCTAREISERFHVPTALLMNVLKVLGQGEMIRSIRGARGGYVLSQPAIQITLANIIAAVEGPIRFVQCTGEHALHEPECDLLDVCPVILPVHRIHDRLNDFLSQITLAEIVDDTCIEAQGVALSVEGEMLNNEESVFAGAAPPLGEG